MGVLLLVIVPLLLLSGCKEESPLPPGAPPEDASSHEPTADALGKQGGEWFWRDRLSIRPVPVPVETPSREDVDLMTALFNRLEEETPASLEEEIALLAEKGEKAVALLAEKLGDPNQTARFLAAAALGRIDHPATAEPLLKAIEDVWLAVAGVAAECLIEKKEPWTMPRLIKCIGPYPVDFNRHLIVRAKVAAGLLDLGNYSGVPFLIKILKENTPAEELRRAWDETPRMAWEKEVALGALAALAGDDFNYQIDGSRPAQAAAALEFEAWWLANRVRLWEEAPDLDDPLLTGEIELIVSELSTFQMRNKDGAQFMLRMLGPPVFPHLAAAISHENQYIAFHTLDVISQIAPLAGSRAAAWGVKLTGCLADARPLIRSQACRALGALGTGTTAADLAPLLKDSDPDVALSAAFALGRIGGGDAAACLEKALNGLEPGQLFVEITAALIRIGPGREDLLLRELLNDDLTRQESALQKVIELTGDDFSFQLGGPVEENRQAVERMGAALRGMER